MSDNKKVFVGGGWIQHPQWLKCSISEKGLHELLNNLEGQDGRRYAKININLLAQKNDHGRDVEITLDTWKKGERVQPRTSEPLSPEFTAQQERNANDNSQSNLEDLPF